MPGAVSQELVSTCVEAEQRLLHLLDAANNRIDMARQSNSPAEMRAAVNDLQRVLLDARAELGRCAALQQAAALAPDPHAGRVTPAVPQVPAPAPSTTTPVPAAPTTPVAQPGSATKAQTRQASGAGGPVITFRSMPSPPRGAAENAFEVTVEDHQGKPLDGADVSLLFYMPAMPSMKMPEMRNNVTLKGAGNGKYTGTGQVMMAGSWTVTVSVKQNGREIGQQKVTVTAR